MQYYDSDCPNFYETTYSEDEKIAKYKKLKRDEEAEQKKKKDVERESEYENRLKALKDNEESIIYLPGIDFVRFGHTRIKFSFQPCKIAKYVGKRVKFYISLIYKNESWQIRRDSIPVDYKSRIYKLLFENNAVDDDHVEYFICAVYTFLKKWAEEQDKFRLRKYKRYRKGSDVYMDSNDEEVFLSNSEVEELHRKRDVIWKRMLPPTKKPKEALGRCRRRIRRVLSSSDSPS